MIENKENIIVNKSIQFALEIIEYCEKLENAKKFVIANRLLKAVTPIGANIHKINTTEVSLKNLSLVIRNS